MNIDELNQLNESELLKKDYQKYYSENSFWDKIKNFSKAAGKKLILECLKLYFAMKMDKVSQTQKVTILAALGYFIFPIDLIPDFIPAIGYLDDAAIVAAVIALIEAVVDDEVTKAAENKLNEWFD